MEADGVGDAIGLSSWIVEAVAAVVFHGWANVPGELAVHGPAGAFVRFDVFDGSSSGRGEGSTVEVEVAV